MNNRYVVLSFFLIITLGFSGWLYVRFDHTQQAPIDLSDDYPNAFASNVTVITFNRDGHIGSRIHTPKLTHFKKDDTSHFEQPHITLYKANQPPWTIDAHFGKSVHGSSEVIFWDHVRIQQKGDKNRKDTLITTSRLRYIPETRFATTDKMITLKQPGLQVSSVGLQAYLDQEKFNLLSQARGYYETKP